MEEWARHRKTYIGLQGRAATLQSAAGRRTVVRGPSGPFGGGGGGHSFFSEMSVSLKPGGSR
jgi:hypothetical protein